MYGDNYNAEAILYYLYMMADGEVLYSEEKIFDKICKELYIDADMKNSVIRKCKNLAVGKSDIFGIILKENLAQQVGEEWYGSKDDASLARVIWNLISLGYADSNYSSAEKMIVNYLVNKWSVKREVYQELVDIADTVLALSKQKEWVFSMFPVGYMRDKKENALDFEINKLLDDVKLTIQELAM